MASYVQEKQKIVSLLQNKYEVIYLTKMYRGNPLLDSRMKITQESKNREK
jgi:hypothetical protein